MRTLYLLLALMIFGQMDADAQRRSQLSKDKIDAQRIAFITTQLDLTPEESQKFWPVFNEYEKKRDELKSKYKSSLRIEEITDENASELVNSSIAKAEEELALKKDYTKRLSKIISMKKIATLHLVEKEFKRQILARLKDKRNMRKERQK